MTIPASHVDLRLSEVKHLRAVHYNATLDVLLPIHADLRILRLVPDAGVPSFEPGQFLTLGLGNWEPRVDGVDEEQIDSAHRRRLAKRAYSISCSLLDVNATLRRGSEFSYLEFYVVLVRHGQKRPPSLTPRLFGLRSGDRLFVENRAAGNYTLRSVKQDENVFFFATGTGEAPHNTMIAELLARGHRGQIISVVSVRYARDAAYRTCHEELMRRYPNYHYFVLTTREPASDELSTSPISARCHVQDLIVSGELERICATGLDPANTRVFLCGNSEMIGAQHANASSPTTVRPGSMLDLLVERGFQIDQTGQVGNIHFERYW